MMRICATSRVLADNKIYKKLALAQQAARWLNFNRPTVISTNGEFVLKLGRNYDRHRNWNKLEKFLEKIKFFNTPGLSLVADVSKGSIIDPNDHLPAKDRIYGDPTGYGTAV